MDERSRLTLLPGVLALTICLASPALADTDSAALDPCLLAELQTAITMGADELTVAELRLRCTPPPPSLAADADADNRTADSPIEETVVAVEEGASLKDQIAAEQQSLDRSYSLTPHWPNYLLAYSYNRELNNSGDAAMSDGGVDQEETLLQVSVKFPLWREVLGTNNDLLFAYTSKSWFQAYNNALSKPFRETNYEPEAFWRHYGGPKLLGIEVAGWDLGYLHQSNGRSEPLSRSWDRLNARLGLILNSNLSVLLRAWYRLPESDDDNPDIDDYLGYGDLRAIWAPNRNTFTAMYRPGTEKDAVELTWSYPINDHFRIYAQYFRGYGESLID
ncbi:MAG: phospholipase A, partial [Pseudomonadales bacterium]|nr:phospholipase A [Pseudomonadales bacterium]